jgi:hypothetical protein
MAKLSPLAPEKARQHAHDCVVCRDGHGSDGRFVATGKAFAGRPRRVNPTDTTPGQAFLHKSDGHSAGLMGLGMSRPHGRGSGREGPAYDNITNVRVIRCLATPPRSMAF